VSTAPPGWPAAVPPPDAPGWVDRASGWLFDQVPADLRAHDVLRRHPLLLAYVAVGQVDAAAAAVQRAISSVRADLRDRLEPAALTEGIEALQLEQARLASTQRAVRLVADALAGLRHRPRL
jgi:hypothetical protein